MIVRRWVLLGMCAAAMTAADCSDASPTASNEPEPSPTDTEPDRDRSVHGAFSTPSSTGRRSVTLDAARPAGGEASGTYRVSFSATGSSFDVAVTCLETRGDTAWIGGRVFASTANNISTGTASYFFVIDRSEAEDTPSRDIVSAAAINATPGEEFTFCEARPLTLPVFRDLLGDVVVR